MSQQQLETANEAVVAAMIAAWEAKDLDGVRATLDDDVIFQMHEGADEIRGIDKVCKAFAPAFVADEIQWELVRSHAVGPLVVNERVDRFVGMSDGKGGKRNMSAPVCGVFWVRDGKIAMWRDYFIPGRPADL